MSATDTLREDHRQIRRLARIIDICQQELRAGRNVPLEDMRRITVIISEFLDSIHYSREEDSYFACVAGYGTLREEIRKFMIEHEFSRRIARSISERLSGWEHGTDAREPVSRFLRTYSIYLADHLSKEDAFFDEAASSVLALEEEREMYEQFRSAVAVSAKISEVIQELDYLESQPWYAEAPSRGLHNPA